MLIRDGRRVVRGANARERPVCGAHVNVNKMASLAVESEDDFDYDSYGSGGDDEDFIYGPKEKPEVLCDPRAPIPARLGASTSWLCIGVDSLSTRTACTLLIERLHRGSSKGLRAFFYHKPPEYEPKSEFHPPSQAWVSEDIPAPDDVSLPLCIGMTINEYAHPGGPAKGLLIIDKITESGLVRGALVRPAYQSSIQAPAGEPGAGDTRKPLRSVFFTGYPKALGYEYDAIWRREDPEDTPVLEPSKQVFVSPHFDHFAKKGLFACKRNGEWIKPLSNALYDEPTALAEEAARFAQELQMRKGHRAKCAGVSNLPDMDSGDERDWNADIPPFELGGADYSGRPGSRCRICNRSSENVGGRRGFDYRDRICGGCCELDEITEEAAKAASARQMRTGGLDPHLPFVAWFAKKLNIIPKTNT